MARGRAAAALALAVLATASATAAPAAARASKRTCHPAHTKTLMASARVRVFESNTTHATYGCLLSRKRPHRFYVPDFPTGYDPIAVAGRFVAYGAYSDCAAGFCDPNGVIVQDLRTGHVTFADASLRVATVHSLVLRANGSVAWIQSSFNELGSFLPGFAVVKVQRGQPPVILDSGPTVAPDSLALAGGTLYWTKDGTPSSGALG
ncbi:MAG: hypothetical protein QOG15_565 [Solirubrobacteraceae bacterium]|nr:hypothetical protein [Solirubrobacteraceae bacterium]